MEPWLFGIVVIVVFAFAIYVVIILLGGIGEFVRRIRNADEIEYLEEENRRLKRCIEISIAEAKRRKSKKEKK